jgi:hypothetical protein
VKKDLRLTVKHACVCYVAMGDSRNAQLVATLYHENVDDFFRFVSSILYWRFACLSLSARTFLSQFLSSFVLHQFNLLNSSFTIWSHELHHL